MVMVIFGIEINKHVQGNVCCVQKISFLKHAKIHASIALNAWFSWCSVVSAEAFRHNVLAKNFVSSCAFLSYNLHSSLKAKPL